LDLQAGALAALAPILVSAGIVLGIGVSRLVESLPRTRVQVGGLLAAVIGALALVFVQGTVPTALAVLLLVSSSAVFATSTLRLQAGTPEGLRSAVGPALVIASVMVLFFRVPPVAYSLSLGSLPESIESGLYAPQILVALAALGGIALIALRRVRARAAKHYAPDLDAGGSA